MTIHLFENQIPKDLCEKIIEKSPEVLLKENKIEIEPIPGNPSAGEENYTYHEDNIVNGVRPGYEEFHDKFEPKFIKDENLYVNFDDTALWMKSVLEHCLWIVSEKMSETYGEKILPDQGGLVRMKTGSANGMHSDQMNPHTAEAAKKMPEEYRPKTSKYSFLIYLNDYNKDFTGGLLNFPDLNFQYKPKAGDIIFFIGDEDHLHEVTEVLSGDRYTIFGFSSAVTD